MKSPQKRSPLWTLMTDVGFQLIAVLLVVAQGYKSEMSKAQDIAALVPSLNGQVTGLKGQLQDAHEQLDNYCDEGERLAGTIAQLTKDLGVLGDQLGEKTEELNSLRPGGPVDVVILVDCTGSLEPHHRQLKNALLSLFRWVPRLSSDCRIGVLGFRDKIVYRLKLTSILAPEKDSGVSQQSFIDFINDMDTQAAGTNHPLVLDEAFKMLPDHATKTRKQVLILLGDIGTRELEAPASEFSSGEIATMNELTARAKAWAAIGSREIGSIYVGSNNQSSRDLQWFRSLAQPSEANFSTESTEMFNILFRSIEQQ